MKLDEEIQKIEHMVRLNNQAVHNMKHEVSMIANEVTEEKERSEQHIVQYELYKKEAAKENNESLKILNQSILA